MTIALGFVLALAASATAPAKSPPKVAIVAALTGEATLHGASTRAARLRDWVQAGDSLSVVDGARLIVVFRNGRRFEVRGPARAVVRSESLDPGQGVKELARLPPWPPDIRPEEVRGGRIAGTRVRSGTIEGLVPGDGDVALADDLRLRFHQEPGASEYDVELRDARGRLAFHARTRTTEVAVPRAVLHPKCEYVWSVEALGTAASAEAAFRTLDAHSAAARARVRELAVGGSEPEVREYLEALDQALGLSRAAQP